MVNNRPLFTIDGEVITPNHLICGDKLDDFPPIGNGVTTSNNIVHRYLAHQRRLNGLWTAFTTMYMAQLPTVHKCPPSKEPSIKIGDIVLVPDRKNKRDDWPLATISQVYPSSDGIIRTVEVKFKDGSTLKRSTARLVHLEAADAPIPRLDEAEALEYVTKSQQ